MKPVPAKRNPAASTMSTNTILTPMPLLPTNYVIAQMTKQFISNLFSSHFTNMIAQDLYGTLRSGSRRDWCFEEQEAQRNISKPK
jgi:hypothetical protein